MLTINELAQMVIKIAGKELRIRNVPGPQGVRGRNSDNRLLFNELGWAPSRPLYEGVERTYRWIQAQVEARLRDLLLQ
jgi:nucleoside-diphosphate-sugar epimerase